MDRESFWPLSFLLDEVWLRIRRTLIHNLEQENLWPDTAEYHQFIERQLKLGNNFKSDLFIRILGKIDYAFLNSELVCGPKNQTFASRLPYLVSFGYKIGQAFFRLVNDTKEGYSTVAEVCSAFNVGICLFDYICDTETNLLSDLNNNINEDILGDLIHYSASCQKLLLESGKIPSIEIRLLTKIIAWFFYKLHSFRRKSANTDIWKKLISALLSAYKSELASSTISKSHGKRALRISKNKSTLPFIVIYLVIELHSNLKEKVNDVDFMPFALQIGEIFWMVDDLIDILQDLETFSMNSILMQITPDMHFKVDAKSKYDVLTDLLNGEYIKEHVSRLIFKINSSLDFLRSKNVKYNVLEWIRTLILGYVRNWIG